MGFITKENKMCISKTYNIASVIEDVDMIKAKMELLNRDLGITFKYDAETNSWKIYRNSDIKPY